VVVVCGGGGGVLWWWWCVVVVVVCRWAFGKISKCFFGGGGLCCWCVFQARKVNHLLVQQAPQHEATDAMTALRPAVALGKGAKLHGSAPINAATSRSVATMWGNSSLRGAFVGGG
jgi:hypothetical protein